MPGTNEHKLPIDSPHYDRLLLPSCPIHAKTLRHQQFVLPVSRSASEVVLTRNAITTTIQGENVIKREILVAAAGAAVVATVLSGCSADKSNTSSPSSSSTTTASANGSSTTTASASRSQSATPDAGASTWTVTVNGEEKSVQGTVNCRQRGNGAVEISTSGSAPGSGIDTDVTDGDPLFVGGISLGDSFNGGLTYSQGSDVGEVTGTKDGNTYTISGTGVGSGHKTFHVDVTCP